MWERSKVFRLDAREVNKSLGRGPVNRFELRLSSRRLVNRVILDGIWPTSSLSCRKRFSSFDC